MNPGTGGDNLNRNQLNPQSAYQQRRHITSPVELSECRNQLLLRRARNAERMRRWRQSRQSNETLQEAAIRRAQHAEEVRRWRQSRLASGSLTMRTADSSSTYATCSTSSFCSY